MEYAHISISQNTSVSKTVPHNPAKTTPEGSDYLHCYHWSDAQCDTSGKMNDRMIEWGHTPHHKPALHKRINTPVSQPQWGSTMKGCHRHYQCWDEIILGNGLLIMTCNISQQCKEVAHTVLNGALRLFISGYI